MALWVRRLECPCGDALNVDDVPAPTRMLGIALRERCACPYGCVVHEPTGALCMHTLCTLLRERFA